MSLRLIALAASLAPAVAAAGPATPCAVPGLETSVSELEVRVTRNRDRGAWATLAQDAAQLAQTLDADDLASRACAHYLAGAAHFFLSTSRIDGRRHAAETAGHLVAASLLAPAAMGAVQPRMRYQTAVKRVGVSAGWLRSTRLVTVKLPAADAARTLRLMPLDDTGWRERCGASPTCVAASRWTLTQPAGPEAVVRLPPGQYRLEVVGPCGAAATTLDFGKDARATLAESPACKLPFTVTDANFPSHAVGELVARGAFGERTGATLSADGLPAGAGRVRLAAPGYRPTEIVVSAEQAAVDTTLERCPVTLVIEVDPADARISGDGVGPWGPRAISAARAGYVTHRANVEIPPPETCEGGRFALELALARRVEVSALGPDGAAVTPARLEVNGAIAPPDDLTLVPGEYDYRALHAEYAPATGKISVPTCPPEGRCEPVRHAIRFTPPGESSSGPGWMMAIGGATGAAGLIAGAVALNAQQRIDDYSTKRTEGISMDELVDRRDSAATAANVLVGVGAAVAIGGLAWYLLD